MKAKDLFFKLVLIAELFQKFNLLNQPMKMCFKLTLCALEDA